MSSESPFANVFAIAQGVDGPMHSAHRRRQSDLHFPTGALGWNEWSGAAVFADDACAAALRTNFGLAALVREVSWKLVVVAQLKRALGGMHAEGRGVQCVFVV